VAAAAAAREGPAGGRRRGRRRRAGGPGRGAGHRGAPPSADAAAPVRARAREADLGPQHAGEALAGGDGPGGDVVGAGGVRQAPERRRGGRVVERGPGEDRVDPQGPRPPGREQAGPVGRGQPRLGPHDPQRPAPPRLPDALAQQELVRSGILFALVVGRLAPAEKGGARGGSPPAAVFAAAILVVVVVLLLLGAAEAEAEAEAEAAPPRRGRRRPPPPHVLFLPVARPAVAILSPEQSLPRAPLDPEADFSLSLSLSRARARGALLPRTLPPSLALSFRSPLLALPLPSPPVGRSLGPPVGRRSLRQRRRRDRERERERERGRERCCCCYARPRRRFLILLPLFLEKRKSSRRPQG
jgi:hypothetical protein